MYNYYNSFYNTVVLVILRIYIYVCVCTRHINIYNNEIKYNKIYLYIYITYRLLYIVRSSWTFDIR